MTLKEEFHVHHFLSTPFTVIKSKLLFLSDGTKNDQSYQVVQ